MGHSCSAIAHRTTGYLKLHFLRIIPLSPSLPLAVLNLKYIQSTLSWNQPRSPDVCFACSKEQAGLADRAPLTWWHTRACQAPTASRQRRRLAPSGITSPANLSSSYSRRSRRYVGRHLWNPSIGLSLESNSFMGVVNVMTSYCHMITLRWMFDVETHAHYKFSNQ